LFAPAEVEGDTEAMGAGGAFAQRGEAPSVKRRDSVADRLGIASQMLGDLRRLLPASTGEQDLGATVDKSDRRAQADHQLAALGVLQWTHVHGFLHTT
jgi:hypothetical protein